MSRGPRGHRSLKILALTSGTIGYLNGYVAGVTSMLQSLCDNYDCTVTALAPERLWRNRGGKLFPRFAQHGNFEIIRKGEFDLHILPEDYSYFFLQLEGRSFDILLDFNNSKEDFRLMLAQTFSIPTILTVERAAQRSGLTSGAGVAISDTILPHWQKTMKNVQGLITWNKDDMCDANRIGGNQTPVRHVYSSKALPEPMSVYETLGRNPRQGCSMGSLFAVKDGWKRSWELEQAIPMLLENTSMESFIICGYPSDSEAESMLKRLQKKYPEQVQHIFLEDHKAAVRLLAQSAFQYTPISGDMPTFVVFEALATGTPLILTSSRVGTHLQDCLHCTLDDLAYWVNSVLNDEVLRNGLSENGKRLYQEKFSPEVMARQYYDFAIEVLDSFQYIKQ